MLPGERLVEFEELIKVHLETWKPANLIEADKGRGGLMACKNSPPAWVRFVGE